MPSSLVNLHMPTADVTGVPIARSDTSSAIRWLLAAVNDGEAVSVRFVNAYSIVSAHRDPRYLSLMREAGVSLPDGTPVAFAMRRRGFSDSHRVRGPSFFVRALEESALQDVRHFFLGTTDSTLDQLTEQVTGKWSGLSVSGTYAPPFGEVDEKFVDRCVSEIKASGANCVWVALGTPKQDILAQALAERLRMPCVAVGAAFDFAAGTKHEAPRWMQERGLEWVHRLMSEPGRLWRRYLIGNAQFLMLLLQHG